MDDFDHFSNEELEEKNALLLETVLESHTCADALTLRKRRVKGGHFHNVQQCGVCGAQIGRALSKVEILELAPNEALPAFNEDIGPAYLRSRSKWTAQISEINKELKRRLDPIGAAADAYAIEDLNQRKQAAIVAIEHAVELTGQAYHWSRILQVVVERTNALSAKFKEETKPVELFTSEPELKTWLEERIADDFEVSKEVTGIHLTEDVGVKIDYVLMPKQHLIDTGFLPGPVGLEVKLLSNEGGGFSSRATRFVWQAVSYTDCQFNLADGPARLRRVLLFSNLSFENEYERLKGISPGIYENEKAKWTALLELANHANVGNLMMFGSREIRNGWKIKFAAGTYFSKFHEKCTMHNAQLFHKIRIGNF